MENARFAAHSECDGALVASLSPPEVNEPGYNNAVFTHP